MTASEPVAKSIHDPFTQFNAKKRGEKHQSCPTNESESEEEGRLVLFLFSNLSPPSCPPSSHSHTAFSQEKRSRQRWIILRV